LGHSYSWENESRVGVTVKICAGKIIKVVVKYQNSVNPSNKEVKVSKKSKQYKPGARNPVAQHAHKFNRSLVFKDRAKYRRTAKHNGLEPFAISLLA